MRPTQLLVTGLVTAALLGACSDEGHTTYSRSEFTSTGASITLNGVELQVAEDVLYRSLSSYSYTAAGGGVDVNSATLDGHDFGTSHGRLRIGPTEYGPVEAGDEIRISRAGGVLVNGEHRGDLPPARPTEEEAGAASVGAPSAGEEPTITAPGGEG